MNGSLASTDSVFDGRSIDYYCLTTAGQQSLSFDLTSAVIDPVLWAFRGANRGDTLAVDDDSGTGLNSSLHALIAEGTYVLGATSFDPGEVGAYTLSVSSVAQEVTGCVLNVWVSRGITTAQQISASDCDDAGSFSDIFAIVLKPDQTVTITQTSGAVDAFLTLTDAFLTPVTTDDNSAGGTDARIVFTSGLAFTEIFGIQAGTATAGETGSYSLQIQ